MGCLTAPFKLLGCLGLLVLLGLGWLYRDRLVREVRERVSGAPPAVPATGRPSRAALRSAESKIDSLNGWRADSVVLTAPEVASLVRDQLPRVVREQLDSIEVALGDGEIEVRASLATARLPHEVVGPFGIALREREPVSVAGPVRVLGDRRGEWVVQRMHIRDFPLPRDAVPRLVARALGDSIGRAVPVPVPPGVRAVRIRPGGAVLYGAPRS